MKKLQGKKQQKEEGKKMKKREIHLHEAADQALMLKASYSDYL